MSQCNSEVIVSKTLVLHWAFLIGGYVQSESLWLSAEWDE